MSERTYLICAICNGVNEVSNDTPTETVVVWKYREGIGVTFNCQHCAAIYPLILKRPKKGRELELMIERGEVMTVSEQ